MKLLIQRATNGAKCVVENKITGQINAGLVVYVGFDRQDSERECDWGANKLLNLKLWPKQEKNWAQSVKDLNYGILVISQFTLFCTLKGNKPDFHKAMGGEQAKLLQEQMVNKLRLSQKDDLIQTGVFGAMMNVDYINEGPVTIELEYPTIDDKKRKLDNKENDNYEQNIKLDDLEN